MFVATDLQIRIANDRLDELRRHAAQRRRVRLARRVAPTSAAPTSAAPTSATPTAAPPATLDEALRDLGDLVERAGQTVPEGAATPVRRLVAELISVADRHGVDGTPAVPGRDDPVVVSLRAAGTLARRALGRHIALDDRSRQRIADRFDDVRAGFGLTPTPNSRPCAVVSLDTSRSAEGRAA
jgi:hypothetical protein